MQWKDLYETTEWQRTRERVYERDKGLCKICGEPGRDTHHVRYDRGFFNLDYLILLCRPCHRIWQGSPPNHLDDDHKLKPTLVEIARLAKCLQGLKLVYNPYRGTMDWVPLKRLPPTPGTI